MNRRLAVLDLETDPFKFGRVPKPFAAGFYDGHKYVPFWGDDCVERSIEFLNSEKEPLIIFAHNGGKFDYFFYLPFMNTGGIRIVNSRIIQAYLGIHELRDSYAIMPFRLADFEKDEIDYEKMERDVRESHKEEILKYLKKDCTALYELVVAFFAEFGDKLTVGSSAMTQLKKFHKFKCGGDRFDEKFRKDFYFGGRNQCFESGEIKGPIKIYDVNSMYPYVMGNILHPVGVAIEVARSIKPNTCFVVVTGRNYGAFPVRTKTGGLDFTKPHGTFHTTIHEFEAALETGTFKPVKIEKTYGFNERITFDEFVSHFYSERNRAKAAGDKIHALFYKYVLNSAYGKFSQNPNNYFEWSITPHGERKEEVCPKCIDFDEPQKECTICNGTGFVPWSLAWLHENSYAIWRKPLSEKRFYNITTGASITGAARAVLLRGLHGAIRPLYCDTDSIIAEDIRGLEVDSKKLGAWKLEGVGNRAVICGKKLYAIFDDSRSETCEYCKDKTEKEKAACYYCEGTGKAWCIKKANKGARLTPREIERIGRGEVIEAPNPVPAFKFDMLHAKESLTEKEFGRVFSKRRIKMTAKI